MSWPEALTNIAIFVGMFALGRAGQAQQRTTALLAISSAAFAVSSIFLEYRMKVDLASLLLMDRREGVPMEDLRHVLRLLRKGAIDLVVNIPRSFDSQGRPDGFLIRRAATDLEIPLFTDLQLARAVVHMLARVRPPQPGSTGSLQVLPWRDYLAQTPPR